MADTKSRGDHDQLVSIGANQTNPYDAKASDFPSAGATGKGGSSGHNELAGQSENQIGTRHVEDDGDMTPVPGDRGAKVASNFPVTTNTEDRGSKSAMGCGVDLKTGKITGYTSTPIGEVGEDKVHIAG